MKISGYDPDKPRGRSNETEPSEIQLKKLLALTVCLSIIGCAGLTFGKYPVPSGIGVESDKDSTAKVELSDYTVTIDIGGYSPDSAVVGAGVRLIPFGQWKWLREISKDDLRVAVNLRFIPKTTTGTFRPGALRILVEGRRHLATDITMEKRCASETVSVNPAEPLLIEEPLCVSFKFGDLPPPEKPFSLFTQELPIIEYSLKRKTHVGFLTQ